MKQTRRYQVLGMVVLGSLGLLIGVIGLRSWPGRAHAMIAESPDTPVRVDGPLQDIVPQQNERPTPVLPTLGPTDEPTTAPTTAPTDAPTTAPTDAPTTAPTDAPTTAPTRTRTTTPAQSPEQGTPLPARPTTEPLDPYPASQATPTSEGTPLPARPTTEPLDLTATPINPPPEEDSGGGGGGGGDDDDDDDDEVFEGRITGTVVDQTTGRPMAGIRVRVGDVVVVTDQNGNYDRIGLPEGKYEVELLLDPWQGTPAQEPLVIDLPEGETVVQHLFYNSPPVNATPPTADIIKMLMSKSEIVPRQLPDTGAPDQAGISDAPDTPAPSGVPWLWLAGTLLLFAGGAGLWHAGRRT